MPVRTSLPSNAAQLVQRERLLMDDISNQLCVSTGCRDVEHFVTMFQRYVTSESIFLSTLASPSIGQLTAFVLVLADGTPVMRGSGIVREAWQTASNDFQSPGILLGIKHLTPRSAALLERVRAAKGDADPAGAVRTVMRTMTSKQYFAPLLRSPEPEPDEFTAPTRINHTVPTELVAATARSESEISDPPRRWLGERGKRWLVGADALAIVGFAITRPFSGGPHTATAMASPPVLEQHSMLPVVGTGLCRLTVFALPAGASVELDGIAQGPSPITLATRCGSHRVDIKHATHRPLTAWATLSPNQPESIEVSLIRPVHEVSITSQPEGATIMIDGAIAGQTPAVLNVLGHVPLDVVFEKPGYRSMKLALYSTEARDRVAVRLAKVAKPAAPPAKPIAKR